MVEVGRGRKKRGERDFGDEDDGMKWRRSPLSPDGRLRLNLAGGETKKMEGRREGFRVTGRRESVKRSEEEEKNENEGRGPMF